MKPFLTFFIISFTSGGAAAAPIPLWQGGEDDKTLCEQLIAGTPRGIKSHVRTLLEEVSIAPNEVENPRVEVALSKIRKYIAKADPRALPKLMASIREVMDFRGYDRVSTEEIRPIVYEIMNLDLTTAARNVDRLSEDIFFYLRFRENFGPSAHAALKLLEKLSVTNPEAVAEIFERDAEPFEKDFQPWAFVRTMENTLSIFRNGKNGYLLTRDESLLRDHEIEILDKFRKILEQKKEFDQPVPKKMEWWPEISLDQDINMANFGQLEEAEADLITAVTYYRFARHLGVTRPGSMVATIDRNFAYMQHLLEQNHDPFPDHIPTPKPEDFKLSARALELGKKAGTRADVLAAIQKLDRPLFKKKLFEKTPLHTELRDSQSWLTVNDPDKIKAAVEELLHRHPDFKGRLSARLKLMVGLSTRQLANDPSLYKYYADEILDSLRQAAAEISLDISAIEEASDDGSTKIRYVRRRLEDLRLGNACGDCSSVGSANFGPSITWLYNPFYQVLTIERNGRFIGKIHITLADIQGAPMILIDALEFNPQARLGKPYYDDALIAFRQGIRFIEELAQKQRRGLIALRRSNSFDATHLLTTLAESRFRETAIKVHFALPIPVIADVIGVKQNQLSPWFQSLDERFSEDAPAPGSGATSSDSRLPDLESLVVNPAQERNPRIGELLAESRSSVNTLEQTEKLEQVSQLILADPEWAKKAAAVYELPQGMGLSPKFLVPRLAQMFPLMVPANRFLSGPMILDSKSFVILSRP